MTRRNRDRRDRRDRNEWSGESPQSLSNYFALLPKRRLRDGEEAGIGVVVYSDGDDEYVLTDSEDIEDVRSLLASNCEECSRAAGKPVGR